MLWGGWGERKRERAGRPPRAFYFFDYFILMGIPSGSLCGGESYDIIIVTKSQYKNYACSLRGQLNADKTSVKLCFGLWFLLLSFLNNKRSYGLQKKDVVSHFK